VSAVLAVSGNPRVGSRTHRVGVSLATALAGGEPVSELEVITVADQLFTAPDQRSAELKEAVTTLQSADLAIIATPVYKASYTGLLKSFLDLYNAGDLAGVIAIPVVVSGSPAHAFVGEIHLRPLLTELGATVATPAFTIAEGQLDRLDEIVADWAGRHHPVIDRLLGRE
jgi:FMN reductase